MADMRPQGEPRPDVEAPAGHEDERRQGPGHRLVFALALVAAGHGRPRRPRPGHASASPGEESNGQALRPPFLGR